MENTNVRILPMPVPHPVWFNGGGGYPDALKVSFFNGKVRTYRIFISQPAPQIIGRRALNRLFQENGGYQYQGKHAKK